MTFTTLFNIGDTVAWRIGGRPMIICSIKILSDTRIDYTCSYADADGLPKEATFGEFEVEKWINSGIGFKK